MNYTMILISIVRFDLIIFLFIIEKVLVRSPIIDAEMDAEVGSARPRNLPCLEGLNLKLCT